MTLSLPEGFKEHYSNLTDWDNFEKCLGSLLRKSIRVNTLKASVEDVLKRLNQEWVLEKVSWTDEGFFISHKEGKRQDIGNIPEHNEGLLYVQEASSMIPAIVLDPKPGELILDMCASPGSKTTQIAQMMQNKGKIVAADIRDDRIAILKRNIARMGITNCEIVKKPGQQFKDLQFDRILVDAPCSGTGTMRMQEDIDRWNPAVAARMSFEQKSLLHSAYCVLKKGGILVYSTCSLEPEENEAVIDWLLKRHKKTKLEEIKISGIKRSKPILEHRGKKFNEKISRCLRIWPHDNNTSGFFVAKIKKL
jgi:NOL1/NOP2/sun family putative RNA methylase